MIRYKENRWDVKRLYGSGGMPSSHSATVMGLACAVGLREGLDGSLFAISFVLASVVRILNFYLFESTSNLNVNNKS